MSYVRADDILPKEILEMVQQYVDGEVIYVPRKSDGYKSWGEKTETKKKLLLRNQRLYQEFLSGTSVAELSERYYLTQKSIYRIIRNYKKL